MSHYERKNGRTAGRPLASIGRGPPGSWKIWRALEAARLANREAGSTSGGGASKTSAHIIIISCSLVDSSVCSFVSLCARSLDSARLISASQPASRLAWWICKTIGSLGLLGRRRWRAGAGVFAPRRAPSLCLSIYLSIHLSVCLPGAFARSERARAAPCSSAGECQLLWRSCSLD